MTRNKSRDMNRFLGILCLALGLCTTANGQTMTLSEAITQAREHSVEAVEAKADFTSSYWAWRAYKAGRLPSVYLYGNFMNFDRSLTMLQNYETGKYNYISNYSLQNSIGLAVQQNITATGGTLRLYSDLNRLDEFGDNEGRTWYSQPLSLSYTQPLLTYNEFKWDKKISPKEYEKAKRVYLEAMEEITTQAVEDFFSLLSARKAYDLAVSNYKSTSTLFKVAEQRMRIGSVTMEDYLQLELQMLSDSTAVNDAAVSVASAQMVFNSLLGLDERSETSPVAEDWLPDIEMDYEKVLEYSLENSSFNLGNEIDVLEAQSAVAKAKAERGATVELNAQFGLNNSSNDFKDAYDNLMDQEVVGLSFSIPIFDWGMGKGRVKEAQAQEDVVRAKVEQAEADYRRSVFTAVGQFNNQRDQCLVSRRAGEISQRRYDLMTEKFRSGGVTVTELITAQNEKDEALTKYMTDLGNYWKYYFELRKLALYDFIGDRPLDVNFKEITGYEE